MVLLASAIGIAGWMTAAKERPRLILASIEEQPADPEKEADMLHQVIREFPGALAEAAEWYLKQSQDEPGTEFTVRSYKDTTELDATVHATDPSTLSVLDAPRIIGERALELLIGRLQADTVAASGIWRAFAKSLILRFERDVSGTSSNHANSPIPFAAPSMNVPIVSITRLLLKYSDSTFGARNPVTLFQPVEPIASAQFASSWAVHERSNFAENLALLNADESLHSVPSDPRCAAVSYEAAATFAGLRARATFGWIDPSSPFPSALDLSRAIAHLRLAESLTDWQHNPADWARIENKLASSLSELGHRSEAAEILREVVAENEQRLGLDHPVASASRERLAATLENNSVQPSDLAISAGTLFPNGPEMSVTTLDCAGTSAAPHTKTIRAMPPPSQSRNANADGPLHSTLSESRGQFAQVIREILRSRSQRADALEEAGRHAEAEPHYSHVREQYAALLGPKHNDTLCATRSLARCLHAQGKDAEAMKFARLAEEGWRETLGVDHPRTLLARDLIRSIPTPPQ
jgi:hypothetical protein